MKRICILTLTAVLFSLSVTTAFPSESRLGVGLNYWRTVDEIKDDNRHFDRDGVGLIASYQYWAGLLGVEVGAELLPDRFGDSAVSPEVYLLAGKGIYGGIGIGTTYSDGDFADEPFYALKAGFCLEVLPMIYADIYANYRFNDIKDIDNSVNDIDTDTIFFGAMVRISL